MANGAASLEHAYPRLAAYLASLPRGIDSHPEAALRGSNVSPFLDDLRVPADARAVLPVPVRELLERGAASSAWIAEAHFAATLLAIADHFRMDDAAYEDWVLKVCRRLYDSLVMKIVLAITSRQTFTEVSGSRWGMVHRGTAMELRLGPDRKRLEGSLEFPPRLWNEFLLKGYARALQAAAERVEKTATLRLAGHTDTTARLEGSF